MPQSQATRYTPNPDRPWEHDASADPLAAAQRTLQQADTTDPQGRTLAETSGPQVGDRKSQGGVTGEWDGQTWRKVPDPSSAEMGYHPGLNDSENGAWWKGLASGVSEAATPGKIGTIAGLATAIPSAGISLLPAVAGAVGTTSAVDLMRSFFNTKNAPQSGGEFLTDVGESAAVPLTGAAIGKGASILGNAVGHRKVGTALGAATGGYEGYQRGGVTGALAGGVAGGVAGAFGQTKLQKLAKLFGVGEEAAAAAPAVEEMGGFAPGARQRSDAPKWGPLNEPIPPRDTWDFSTRPPARDPQSFDPEAMARQHESDASSVLSSGRARVGATDADFADRPPAYDPHVVDPGTVRAGALAQEGRYTPNATAHTNPAGIDIPEAVRGVREMQDYQYDGSPDVGQFMPSGQGFSEPAAIKIEAGGGNKGKQAADTLRKLLTPENRTPGIEAAPARTAPPPIASAPPPPDNTIDMSGQGSGRYAPIDMPASLQALATPEAPAAAPYSGPDRRSSLSGRDFLETLIQDRTARGEDPSSLRSMMRRMDGTEKYDPISGLSLSAEDMPSGDAVDLDSQRVGREAATSTAVAEPDATTDTPPSLQTLTGMLDSSQTEPMSFFKTPTDAVGAAYKGARDARAADPAAVHPMVVKQLGTALNAEAQRAGLPIRGGANLEKFLNEWIAPQLNKLK